MSNRNLGLLAELEGQAQRAMSKKIEVKPLEEEVSIKEIDSFLLSFSYEGNNEIETYEFYDKKLKEAGYKIIKTR